MIYRITLSFLFFSLAIKFIAITITNFDLFGDEAQYWLWSQKLDFGYYSKPPLLPWYISLYTYFLGNSFVALKTIPIITYLLTSYTIYLLSNELYSDRKLSLLACISFYLLPSVSISSFLLSTDIILIFFWSLTLLFLIKVRKRQSFKNFILLGIFLGLSFLAKYAAIYFLISLFLLILIDKKTRDIFKYNFLYTCAFLSTAFLILLPNLVWNTKNEWATLSHTAENAGLSRVGFNLLQGFEFLAMQGLMIGPIIFVGFFFIIKKIKFTFETIFLLSFSIPTLSIVLLESILVRANANWAAVALVPFFLLIFNHAYIYSKKLIFINNLFNFLFCITFFSVVSFSYPLKVFDRINGIKAFVNIVEEKHLKEKKYLVIDDRLLYSSFRYELKDPTKVILTPHKPLSKIKNHFKITDPLLPNFDKNFIYIGDIEKLTYLTNDNKKLKLKSYKMLFKNKKISLYEVLF